MKLKIGVKIGLGFGVLIALMLVLGGYSYYSLTNIKGDIKTIDGANKRALLIVKINTEYQAGVSGIRGFIAYGDEKFFKQTEQAMNNTIKLEEELLQISPEEKKPEVRTMIELTTKYRDGLVKDLCPVVRKQHSAFAAGNVQEAQTYKDETTRIARELIKVTGQLTEIVDKAVELNQTIANESMTDTNADVNKISNLSMTLSIISLITGLACAVFLTRMIKTPVAAMLSGTNKYASGDLREEIMVKSGDELEELASAMNTMRNAFCNMIQNIANSSGQVAASSEELTASSEQSAQAANHIASSISTVAEGANEQLAAANEASAVVEQMSAGIQQVAANANQVAAQSAQAADKANDGGKAVDKAVNQMSQIEQTVNTSANVVAKLGERSKEIGQIVDTISGIAGQTNLLALNAAIEAARAGEQGRGFAVVAEEVRKLAEQSQDAAKQIAELIGEIQGDTDKAVAAMNDGTREVKTGAEVVNTAGMAFREIAGLVTQVSGQVKEISAAIQQMATGSQQIVGSVKKIDDLSKKSAGESQGVSAATEEQLASMEEISSSSQALAKLAQDLQAAVARFRV